MITYHNQSIAIQIKLKPNLNPYILLVLLDK